MYKILTLILSLTLSVSSFGQGVILNSSEIENAKSFLEAYFRPVGSSIGAGLNNGWYNTAKPHKLAGFDVSLTLNLVSITDETKFFNVNELNNFSSPSERTPTVLGNGEGATITYDNNEGISGTFTMPDQDVEITAVPIPTLNVGIGLIKGTELTIRYIPDYEFDMGFSGKGTIGLYGGGIKHDILQWLPVVDELPFDLSIQAAFSQLNTSFEVESQSVKQEVGLNVNASTYNLILSKKFSVLTAYSSVGVNNSKSHFESNTNFRLGSTEVIDFNIPLTLDFEKQSEIQAALGVRLKLAIFTLYANQTFSKYPITSAGIGLSFR